MKTTAVQWLEQELIKLGYLHSADYGNSPKVLDALNQAKAMEREQIVKAGSWGSLYSDSNKTSEQYYNETYNNNDRNSS